MASLRMDPVHWGHPGAVEVAWAGYLAWVRDHGEKRLTTGCFVGLGVIVPTLQVKKPRPGEVG